MICPICEAHTGQLCCRQVRAAIRDALARAGDPTGPSADDQVLAAVAAVLRTLHTEAGGVPMTASLKTAEHLFEHARTGTATAKAPASGRSHRAAAEDDITAMDRICALLNDTSLDGPDAYMHIANVVADTGRPVLAEDDRMPIEATVGPDRYGLPTARITVQPDAATVLVHQSPDEPHSFVVHVTASAEQLGSGLSVVVNDTPVYRSAV